MVVEREMGGRDRKGGKAGSMKSPLGPTLSCCSIVGRNPRRTLPGGVQANQTGPKFRGKTAVSCRPAQTSSFISRGSLCLSWQYALGKLADRRTERGEITYHSRRRKRWKENKKETTELRACIWRSRGPWQEQCGKEEGTDTQRGRQPRDQKEIERRITDLGRWMKLSEGYAHVCLYVHRQIQEILHALERIKKSLKGERRESGKESKKGELGVPRQG